MFVDKTKISVKAGDGGNGCCSFRREKFVPKGGPDGGDGGNGGDIILRASTGEQSLTALIYKSRYTAPRGVNGQGAGKHGRNSDPVIIPVPVGTVIHDAETGEFIADLDETGKEAVVAKGGIGGRGNARFASSTNRAPRHREFGTEGEEKVLQLELKLIADVGLVGYPNAGKSTLLSAISDARPKVAPYPFTTLHPVVGIVEYPDYYRVTVADIPGLIDGAHANVGLGHAFLRHIERTRVLLFVLDMGGVDGRTPEADYLNLLKELELYQSGLSKRRALIVANKMDLPQAQENLEALKKVLPPDTPEIVEICAGSGELGVLTGKLRELVVAEKAALAAEKAQEEEFSEQ